jgi:SAM-dependent methyltransferase
MIRSFIYDTLILRLTSRWYAEVLERVPEGASLLDVGIGTAGALLANADLVKRKSLRVVGIDIDADYVARARRRLGDSPLADVAEVRLESVYEHLGGPYDAVYFSGSFMLLPEPERALWHCRALLHPGGRIFFTQTIQKERTRWMEVLKPLLKRVTSIDFGRVTYEDDFRAQVRAAGLELEELTTLARHGSRASCIAVARISTVPADRPDRESFRAAFPLHDAVQRCDEREVAALLEAGADPNVVDDLGMTPLLWAVFGGYAEIVERLCSRGADVGLRGATGETALWHAEDDFGLEDVAAVLRRHGATAT